jgi:very-short-patch-repair endonuclease
MGFMKGSRVRHRHNVPGARELRTRQTRAEAILWAALRSRSLSDLKFRRQHPIGPFVVDFCCPDRQLIVEVDGGIHDTQGDHDAEREELLVAAGYHVVRFRNEAIVNDLPSVLNSIRTLAEQRTPLPPADRRRTGNW